MAFWKPPVMENADPGMNATPSFRPIEKSFAVSVPTGRFNQRKNPPEGSVQNEPGTSENCEASAVCIASFLSLYIEQSRRTWLCINPRLRNSATTRCPGTFVQV